MDKKYNLIFKNFKINIYIKYISLYLKILKTKFKIMKYIYKSPTIFFPLDEEYIFFPWID